jgi:hypothetical protein
MKEKAKKRVFESVAQVEALSSKSSPAKIKKGYCVRLQISKLA